MIPRRDTLWEAVVHAPEYYRKATQPWGDELEVDMRATHPILTQMSRRAFASADQLVTEPMPWAALEYETIESPRPGEPKVDRDPGGYHGMMLGSTPS